LQQYPIESSSEATFACDASLRNAKFGTSLQSLSIPRSEEEEPIFAMLDEQQFTLVIDFINTKYECNNVYVTQTTHENPKSLTFGCSYNRSVLTTSIVLNSHTVTLNYDFDLVLSIGGLRVSLYGQENKLSSVSPHAQYLVRELNFSQPFLVNNQTLASDPSIELSLTRVVNITDPLTTTEPYLYSALWIPASLTSTSIVKLAEVVFHCLLFTIVCLELFGLVFLLMKLIFLPLFNIVRRFLEKHSILVHPHQTSVSPESGVSNIKEK
jgi:hypothetical protein